MKKTFASSWKSNVISLYEKRKNVEPQEKLKIKVCSLFIHVSVFSTKT